MTRAPHTTFRCMHCHGRYLNEADLRVRKPHNCPANPERDYDWDRPAFHEYLSPDVSGWDANGAPA